MREKVPVEERIGVVVKRAGEESNTPLRPHFWRLCYQAATA